MDDPDGSPPSRRYFLQRSIPPIAFPAAFALALAVAVPAAADTFSQIQTQGRIVYGADEEGGAPYIYLDRKPPHRRVGFEVDLMAAVARELKVEAAFQQGLWDTLLKLLSRGKFDVVVNGYELTEVRTRDYLATRPYYLLQLQLMAKRGGPIRSAADLNMPRPDGGRWKVGVLGASTADGYAVKRFDERYVEVVRFDGATNAMTSVRNGQIDATLQDAPAASFYVAQDEFASDLTLAGPPEGSVYVVMYLRPGDERLRDALDGAIERISASGELEAIYRRHGVWSDAQTILKDWRRSSVPTAAPVRARFDLRLLVDFAPTLLLAAGATMALSCLSMPLAILIGLLVAVGRRYGPGFVAKPLTVYVELIRGTPLMLQLYLIFFVLPQLGVSFSPWVSGILGLAINYSAYEAEIYRAGLQAVPTGQWEAALSLGMSKRMALRRVIVPQAVRIVIPTVTSDFIALFKDTSVCSILTINELTKQYTILSGSVGGVLEFGVATAVLYLVMSWPLAKFSRWAEAKIDGGAGTSAAKGGAA